MPQNRNQHFVAQFYLRNFSPDGRSISVFHLPSRRHHLCASIKGQASRPYFYGKSPAVEDANRVFENAGADALRSILEADQPPTKGSERAIALLAYIIFQLQRTPAAAMEMEEMATTVARRTFQSHPEIRRDQEMLAALKDMRVRYRAPVLNAIKVGIECAPVLFDLESKLLVNRTPVGFVTSDVAVVLHNKWCEGLAGRGTTGFACRGLLIMFPISPTHSLLFYDGTVYKVGDRGERVLQLRNVPDVELLNRFQFLSAHQNIYYRADPQTRTSIDMMTGTRAPRYERVLSERAVSSEDENDSLVHFFHAPLPINADLTWLRVNQAMKRITPKARLGALRSEARRMAAFLRGPVRRPQPRTGALRRSWTVVPD